MGRMYHAGFDGIALTTGDADFDVVQLNAASGKRIVIHAMSLTTSRTADEVARFRWVRRSTAGSSGGTAIVPKATDEGNAVAASTVVTPMVTAPGTIISDTWLPSWYWTQRGELLWIPTPECRVLTADDGILCLHCATSLTAANLAGGITFEEL